MSRRSARLPPCLQSANVRSSRRGGSATRSREEPSQQTSVSDSVASNLISANAILNSKPSPFLALAQAVGLASMPRDYAPTWDWEGSASPKVLSEDNENFLASDQKPPASRALSALSCRGSSSNVIIFDWDDTLCPTTYLQRMELSDDPARPKTAVQQAQLERHALLVEAVLREAAALAHVAIVTLAQRTWLSESQSWHFPGLDVASLLAELGVTVYYAQDGSERHPIAQRCDWAFLKQTAMERCLGDWYAEGGGLGGARSSVISVGDGPWERLALRSLFGIGPGSGWPEYPARGSDVSRLWTPTEAGRPWCKTVKLMCGPSLEDLGHELCSLPLLLRDVVICDEDFDLCVDTPGELAASTYASV